jgi:hypothetical protein
MRNAIQGFTVLAALSFGAPAFAANSATSIAKDKAATDKSPWTFVFTLETASNMMKDEQNGREAQTALETTLLYKFNKITTLKVTTAVYKDQTGAQNSGFTNSTASLVFNTVINTNIDWKNSVSGVLPTDRKVQDETSLQGAGILASTFVFKNLFWDSSALAGVSASRNFHEYSMNADGIYNVRNTAGLTLGYTLPLFGDLKLDTAYKYTQAWLYNDDNRMKFLFSADLSYAVTPKLDIYVGTSNEGSALKPNGVDSNIEIFNDTSSIVKAGLNYSI